MQGKAPEHQRGDPPAQAGAVYLDSQKVGRIMLPGLRAEAKANPEVKDDT